MGDWVASDNNEYFNKAVKFALDINELSKVRKNLRKKVLKSPSFDTSLFAQEFDKALRKIWNNFIQK